MNEKSQFVLLRETSLLNCEIDCRINKSEEVIQYCFKLGGKYGIFHFKFAGNMNTRRQQINIFKKKLVERDSNCVEIATAN